MTRRVQWSAGALDDFDSQIAYIAADNPQAARRVADRVIKAAEALGDLPTGRPDRMVGTYEKLVKGLPFVIAYVVDDDAAAVSILRVIHAARDWPDETWPN